MVEEIETAFDKKFNTILVQFRITHEENEKIKELMQFSKSSTRSRTIKFCIEQTYEVYKNVKK